MNYPNMFSKRENGMRIIGYHADKIPVFAQAKNNTEIVISTVENLVWLNKVLKVIQDKMLVHSGQRQWEWIKLESPDKTFTVHALDPYLCSIYSTNDREIHLAYRGVEFVAKATV